MATVGIDGAMNAAVLAVQILAVSDAEVAARLDEYRSRLQDKIVKANADLKEVKYEFKTN